MHHRFDPVNAPHLDSEERRQRLKPDFLLDQADVEAGWVCVDLGCGVGVFSIPLAQRVGEKGLVYAVDVSEEMLDILRSKKPPESLRLVRADLEKEAVPLDKGIADLCLATCILHEVFPPERLLREAYRLLKREGRLLIVEWLPVPSPSGPPLELRRPPEERLALLRLEGYAITARIDLPPYNYALLAEKA